MRPLSRPQAVFTMVLVTLMWSIAGVVSKQLQSAQGFEVTFWRSAFTAGSLLLLWPLMQGRDAFVRVAWRSPALWVSGLCWSVMFTAFMLALTMTSVANVLITMALGPLFTALLARTALGKALPARTWLAIGVAALGIAWMYAPQIKADAPLLGSLVALGVPLAAAVQWTLTQHLQSKSLGLGAATVPDLVPAVLIGAVLSSLYTLPLAAPFSASAADLGWLALLGVVQLAIPCSLSVVCARVLPGPEVSLLALLEIVFGIGLAWAFANEALSTSVLFGGGLVLCALAANEALGLREAKPA